MTDQTFRVVRDCCTSGNCFACKDKTPFGTPLRVTHGDRYPKAKAERVARLWKTYKATVEPDEGGA